jgi:hypothetical protein
MRVFEPIFDPRSRNILRQCGGDKEGAKSWLPTLLNYWDVIDRESGDLKGQLVLEISWMAEVVPRRGDFGIKYLPRLLTK